MSEREYIVMEQCDDYQQALVIRSDSHYPLGGILDWAASDKEPRAVFPDRATARAAINRTEHYRLAFASNTLPERRYCVIVPIRRVAT